MGDFVHKPDSGSLFKNTYKKEDKHPDYKGTANIGGVLMDVAAWIKDGNGGKFMSLKFSPPRQKQQPDRAEQARNFQKAARPAPLGNQTKAAQPPYQGEEPPIIGDEDIPF